MKKNKVIVTFLAYALLLSGLALAGYFMWRLFVPSENPPLPTTTVILHGTAFTAEVANTTTTRIHGLSGRVSLGEKEGMLFIFSSPGRPGFWMKDMNFGLDLIWMRNKEAAEIMENVPPPKKGEGTFSLRVYTPSDLVDTVLEVPAGSAKKFGIIKGDKAHYDISSSR